MSSWFTDLAGKAEDFLVKLDQNAAAAAQVVTKDKKSHSRAESLTISPEIVPAAANVAANTPSSLQSFSLKSSKSFTDVTKAARPAKIDRDAELMASLADLKEQPASESPSPIPAAGPALTDEQDFQENNQLRNEIRSLGQELKKAVQNSRQAEKECRAAQSALKSQTSAIQELEQRLASLEMENTNLTNQLSSDRDLTEDKLSRLQQQLDVEVSCRLSAEEKLRTQSQESERERCSLNEQANLYRLQLQSVREELEASYQALNEYKLRAQRILQDKDRLLQDVKCQQQTSQEPSDEVILAELRQLAQERDLLREECSQTGGQLQQLRTEMSRLDCAHEEQVRRLADALTSATSLYSQEKCRREECEAEVAHLTEEVRSGRQDAAQQRMHASACLRQHEEQLEQLRQQLLASSRGAAGSAASQTEAELERRLRLVTEALVSKQAALEVAQSERSSLALQLERALELNTQTAIHAKDPQLDNSVRVSLNITDDAKATTGTGGATGVSHRVRHAYSTLDSFNFQLGQALRRRPAARLVLFIYMVVLHFWVAFVLLTYSPEMHQHERQSHLPA